MNNKSLGYRQHAAVLAASGIAELLPASCFDGGTIKASVKFFVIQPEAQALRWVDDGTTPTATLGNLLAVGQWLVVYRCQFAGFKAIQAAASSIVNVTAYDGEGFPFMPR